MTPFENPGAYKEGDKRQRKRSLEDLDLSEVAQEKLKERFFEDQKREIALNRARQKMDTLRHRLETTSSLSDLRSILDEAKQSGEISSAEYHSMDRLLDSLEREDRERDQKSSLLSQRVLASRLPFGDTRWAHRLEESQLGQNPLLDLIGFSYGFFIQGGAIVGYLLLRALFDLLLLPVDLYQTLKQSR